MLISLSFWLCGLPAAWFFGIVNDWGAVGLWWGMIVGVALTAVLLLWRFHWRSRSIVASDIA
jgi:MATE family multidrug resistance protein